MTGTAIDFDGDMEYLDSLKAAAEPAKDEPKQWLPELLHRVGLQHYIHEFSENKQTSDEELRRVRDFIYSIKFSEPATQPAPAVLKCNGEGCTLVHNGRGEHVPAAEYIEQQAPAVPPLAENVQLRIRLAILDAQEVVLPERFAEIFGDMEHLFPARRGIIELRQSYLDAQRAAKAWRDVARGFRDFGIIGSSEWHKLCKAYDALAGRG